MKIKKYGAMVTFLVFVASTPVRADFWGGDSVPRSARV